MAQKFELMEILPGIYRIRDCMGVCCALAVGEADSLLWDTGYGLYDLATFIAPYVRGTLRVILSHAHRDHACGCRWFPSVEIHPDDLALCRTYTGRAHRRIVLQTARDRGLIDPEFDEKRYLSAGSGGVRPLSDPQIELGGLTVRFYGVSGHTPGSLAAYLPQRRLLLTADSWNPTTWLFFPESLPLETYAANLRALRDLGAEHVLCSHDASLHRMDRLRAYIDGLNADTFAGARPVSVPPYTRISTFACHPEPGSVLVFNGDKRS